MIKKTDQSKNNGDDEILINVDKQPEFPGGLDAMMRFITERFVYPVELFDNNIVGRLIANFTVNIDGSLSDINIIHGPHKRLDEETKRVILMMPKWKPGELKGKPVRVKYTIPILIRTLKEASYKTHITKSDTRIANMRKRSK